MDAQGSQTTSQRAGRWITGLLLLLIAAHQVRLGVHVWQLMEVFPNFGETPNNLVVFLVWTQPLMWLFVAVTLVLAFDVFRRPRFLLLNSTLGVLSIALGTAFLQLLVMLSAYAPILDLGRTS